MTLRKPNLFLIGAMKAGTHYVRKLLKAHPDIFMCEPDEPSYFVDPQDLRRIYPEMWQRRLWRSEERYLELFRPAVDAPILRGRQHQLHKAAPSAGSGATDRRLQPLRSLF